MLISQYFPVWVFTLFPYKKIILASYEADFASSWGRKVRDTIDENKEFLGIEIRQDTSASHRWEIAKHGGSMNSAGVGGAITGKGADILIIDDPVKNQEEANSKTVRERHWEWFQSTALTRLEPGGGIVLIMSRWHEDDLAGRLLKYYGQEWEVVKFPAIAEQDEYLDGKLFRKAGDPLWPERWPKEAIEQIRKDIGEYWYSALYRQSPTPLEGHLFKRSLFEYYTADDKYFILPDGRLIPKTINIFFTIDPATSERSTASYFCLGVFGFLPTGEILVIEIFRDRIDASKQVDIVKNYYMRYMPSVIFVEAVGYQKALVQLLKKEGVPAREFEARGDKTGRAITSTILYEQGKVLHPQNAEWLETFETELLQFPHAENDDQVDVLSMASIASMNLKLYSNRERFLRKENPILGGFNEE